MKTIDLRTVRGKQQLQEAESYFPNLRFGIKGNWHLLWSIGYSRVIFENGSWKDIFNPFMIYDEEVH